MAKPLTQKKLKAMQKKAQERLDAQRKQLASLEQTYAGLKGKPSPFTDKATSPSKLAAAEGGAIGAAQIASRMPVQFLKVLWQRMLLHKQRLHFNCRLRL
jgi:hypothetical protein